jgi:hypothetical protein
MLPRRAGRVLPHGEVPPVTEIVMRYVAFAAGVLAVGSSCMAQKIDAAAGRAVRMVTDDTGVHIVNSAAKVRPAAGGSADNIIWTFHEPISIPENVAMGPTSLWVGQHLNNRRLQRFEIAGEGFPANEYLGTQGGNGAVGAVASAKVVLTPKTGPARMRLFADNAGLC